MSLTELVFTQLWLVGVYKQGVVCCAGLVSTYHGGVYCAHVDGSTELRSTELDSTDKMLTELESTKQKTIKQRFIEMDST